MEKSSFEKAVAKAKRTKKVEDFEDAFTRCLENKSRKALESVYALADMVLYSHLGNPHKREIKEAAIATMLCWGEEALSLLLEKVLIGKFGQQATASTIPRAFVFAASSSMEMMANEYKKVFEKLHQKIDYEQFKNPSFIEAAYEVLMKYALNIQPEVSLPFTLVTDLGIFSMYSSPQFKEHNNGSNPLNPLNTLFSAVQARWFRFNDKNIKSLTALLNEPKKSEEEIHKFLASNPQILEPFYAKIWSKVRLGENLIADFLIKQMDGNYVVVEIEKPSDTIVGKNGNLSAKTTHAIRQALEYRDWIASNQLYAQQNFDGIWRPSALVIIGKESDLTQEQLARLRQENESRQGIVKIVGFDWLYNRANTIRANIIRHNFDRISVQESN